MTKSFPLPLALTDRFIDRLSADGQNLSRKSLNTLQLNIGKMCNLSCHHCHVEAGPRRSEIMTWHTMEAILNWFDYYQYEHQIQTVDLTGGAPEMNPHFRTLVRAFHERGVHIIDRCNLTILLELGYEDLIKFFAEHQVEISASLPCYLGENVDKQRGRGVFIGSIEALRQLNQAGYGQNGSDLRLDLVYNPVGYDLPPDQNELERAYKQHLEEHFGITFNRLWTITNMPIKRFEHALKRDGEFEPYMNRLQAAHNQNNVEAVMCRSLISIGWEGGVYDCDFNQMLQMPIEPTHLGSGDAEDQVERCSRKLWDYTPRELIEHPIRTGAHCFGCTAGSGSSCTGALA